MRINMETRALKDPRRFDWPETSHATHGYLGFLSSRTATARCEGKMLDSGQANDDATEYALNARLGVQRNNGDDVTAEGGAFNIARWCDRNVEGSSMAVRMASLADATTSSRTIRICQTVSANRRQGGCESGT